MPQRKRHLADNPEIAAGTGRALEDWAKLLRQKGLSLKSADELAEYLMDEFHLPLYWAHCIAYRLALDVAGANGKDRASSDCLTPRLGV
jgi:hypothetical protein